MTAVFTRRYETHKTLRGFCFTFYCDLCDGSVTTPEYQTDAFEEALSLAQSEARRQFNMCHQCGRWICDEHYNEDEMQCIACAPRRERRPPLIQVSTEKTSPYCGGGHANGDCFCQRCGQGI